MTKINLSWSTLVSMPPPAGNQARRKIVYFFFKLPFSPLGVVKRHRSSTITKSRLFIKKHKTSFLSLSWRTQSHHQTKKCTSGRWRLGKNIFGFEKIAIRTPISIKYTPYKPVGTRLTTRSAKLNLGRERLVLVAGWESEPTCLRYPNARECLIRVVNMRKLISILYLFLFNWNK